VIILEGPDGAGKSTLADSLEQLTGFRSEHLVAPVDEPPLATCIRYLDDTLASGKGIIFDRFHLSEHVYGPIARGVDQIGAAGAVLEQSMWDTVRPVVVLCLPPHEIAQQNWALRNAARAEMIERREMYDAVYSAYQSIRTTLPVIQYDYTRDSAVNVLARLNALHTI